MRLIVVHSPSHFGYQVKNGQIQVLVGSTASPPKALRDFIITAGGGGCWGRVLGGVAVASTGATSGAMCQVLRNAVGLTAVPDRRTVDSQHESILVEA